MSAWVEIEGESFRVPSLTQRDIELGSAWTGRNAAQLFEMMDEQPIDPVAKRWIIACAVRRKRTTWTPSQVWEWVGQSDATKIRYFT